MKAPPPLLRGFLTVGFWTFASRVFGFLRDVAFAAALGAGPVAEAFLVAFSLPNIFRRFFAEGAFNMAFVPMLSRRLANGQSAEAFAAQSLSGLGVVLIGLIVIAQAAMPLLILATAGGFLGDERFDLSVLYSRIAFVYVLFICLAALLSGVLNALGHFAAAAAAPLILNLVMIGTLIGAELGNWNTGLALAICVPLAGAIQLAFLWWAVARSEFSLTLTVPALTPEMRRLIILAAPAALAGGVVQVNLLVGRQVASFFDGAVAWLSYADRLYQLPLGVVGIALGVVLLPDLSRRLASDDVAGGRAAFSRAIESALALGLPATVALAIMPLAIVSVLFERGAFSASDSVATATALAVYAAGLPAFVLQKILQPLYFAREDTRTPLRYAIICMVVNAGLAIGLAPIIGFLAAPIGTSLAGWLMLVLLWRGSRGMGEAVRLDPGCRRRWPRLLAASAIMGAALAMMLPRLDGMLSESLARYPALAILVAGGGLIYLASLLLLGTYRLSDIRRLLVGRGE